MATLDPSSTVLLTVAGAFGLTIGSFLNVVIRRLPVILKHHWLREAGKTSEKAPLSLAFPPSHCPTCRHPLKAWHKIPVLGYLLLHGRCGFCKAPISTQYVVVELLTLFVSIIIVMHLGLSIRGIAALTFSWTLIVLAFIDHNTRLLPDELTLGLLWLGLVVNAFGLFTDAASAVLGAGAGYCAPWLIYHGMKLATGREGLGYGDMKLLAATGAWCGWQALPFIMFTASATGLAVSGVLLIRRKMKKNEPIPFGTHLSAAAWLFFIYAFVYGRSLQAPF